jgi:hypothetical protein
MNTRLVGPQSRFNLFGETPPFLLVGIGTPDRPACSTVTALSYPGSNIKINHKQYYFLATGNMLRRLSYAVAPVVGSIQRRVTQLRTLLTVYATLQIYNFDTGLWKLHTVTHRTNITRHI